MVLFFTATGIVVFSAQAYSQKGRRKQIVFSGRENGALKINDSTWLMMSHYSQACKSNVLLLQLHQFQSLPLVAQHKIHNTAVASKDNFIHGDITYDYFYRSAIDTPFSETNIQQHNVRANFQFVVSEQIPVALQINSRQTNSPLFKNYTDLNVQFNSHSYNTAARDKLANEIVQKIVSNAKDSLLLKNLGHQQLLQDAARQWLEDPKQLQQLIESRQILAAGEEQLKSRLSATEYGIENRVEDSIRNKEENVKSRLKDSVENKVNAAKNNLQESANKEKLATSATVETRRFAGFLQGANATGRNSVNSLGQYAEKNKAVLAEQLIDSMGRRQKKATRFIETYKAREAQYERGKKTADSLEQVYKTAKENTQQKITAAKNIFSGGSADAVAKKVKEYGLDTSSAFKWYKRINAVQQFSVGRSMVDYSELSAKNISITGIQAVYHDKTYIAFASGSVDYRYRDFIIRGYSPPKQWLNLVRIGLGARESHDLILTVYQGKKQANYFTAANQPAVNKIFGITLQGSFRLDAYNYIIAEGAKSSYPQVAAANVTPDNTSNKTFNFSNHSNEAYSIQLFSRIAGTGTRIYGQYKYLGRNFQSFSVFNINSDFTAWQARVDQYFLKRKLFVTAALRTNDYTNPYVTNTFKTNTVFKSIQATVRIKKMPVLSVGYMPSSQITSIGNQVVENRFYTLTASANHVYRIRNGYMHTGLVYTKFYNDAPDTGFIYYNARNWFVYHNIISNKWSFNSFVTLSYNNVYQLLTIDQGMTCKLSRQLNVGGGLKWNRLNNQENHLGYYGNVQFRINKLGDFNLSFDRGYIPGLNETLRKSDFGRATYIKIF